MQTGLHARMPAHLRVDVGFGAIAASRAQLRLLRQVIQEGVPEERILLILQQIESTDCLLDKCEESLLDIAIKNQCSYRVIESIIAKSIRPSYETFKLCLEYKAPKEVIEILIQSGMPIYEVDGQYRISPVDCARSAGCSCCVVELLENHMDRLLLSTVRNGDLEGRVNALLDQGARVKRKGIFLEGESKLVHFALNAGYSDTTISRLIAAGGTVCLISDQCHPQLKSSTRELLQTIDAVRSFVIRSRCDNTLSDDDSASSSVE